MGAINLYITLEPSIASQIASMLGGTYVNSPANADISIIFPSNLPGGVDDPKPHLSAKDIVVAGLLGEEAHNFARTAMEAGIPAKNILISGNRSFDPSVLQPYLTAPPPKVQKRVPKVIGFIGRKGGVGRTTFAASLVAHYANTSEKAALVETGPFDHGKFHIEDPKYGDVVRGNLDELIPIYRRLVIDASPEHENLDEFDIVIAVVDADLIQSIEPTKEFLEQKGVKPIAVIYNNARALVPEELVSACFPGTEIIPVEDDFHCCSAALTAKVPAAVKSDKIARAVGKIAALIDG